MNRPPLDWKLARRVSTALLASAVLGQAACLDPRGSDAPGYSHRLVPAGDSIPSPDTRLAATIRSNDGLDDDLLQPRTAYQDGRSVYYWDFGEANSRPQPAWIFRRRDGEGKPLAFEHPSLIDQAPGDDNYSPFCQLQLVYVTDRYQDERITSFAALEDALELGLIEEPEPLPDIVQWPVVRDAGQLELPDGQLAEAQELYYRGVKVTSYALEHYIPPLEGLELSRNRVPTAAGYILRRQADGEPVADNLLFAEAEPGAPISGLWEEMLVVVPNSYVAGDIATAANLFTVEEDGSSHATDVVIEYEATGRTLFRALIPDFP